MRAAREGSVTMRRYKLYVSALALVLLVIVILQNTAAVETRILFFTLSMPRALLLALATLVGFILGLIAAGRSMRKKAGTERQGAAAS